MPKKLNHAGDLQNYDSNNGQYSKSFEKGFERGIANKSQNEKEKERMIGLMKKKREFEEREKGSKMDEEYFKRYDEYKKENNITNDLNVFEKEVYRDFWLDYDGEKQPMTERWTIDGEYFVRPTYSVRDPIDGKYVDPTFNSREELEEALKNPKILHEAAEKERKIREEKEAARERQVKANLERYKNATNEEKSKMVDEFYAEEMDELFSEENITSGTYVGGYSGYSKSKSAIASEEQGSKPISKWNKDDIMEYIEDEPSLEPFYDELRNMKISKLKETVLTEDGWHHTGALYNKTRYYSIASPNTIVLNIRIKRDEMKKAFEKGLKG